MAFFLTVSLEFLVYVLMAKIKIINLIAYSILINITTWPTAMVFYNSGISFIVIEMIVFLIEIQLIYLLFRVKYLKSVGISFVANFITSLAGIIFF